MGKFGRENVLWTWGSSSAGRQCSGQGISAATMEKMKFSERVYSVVRAIPKGKVTTYREIAAALNTKGFQAIGQALRCNPYAPHVPCHRVVRSNGSIGGFKGKKEGKEIQKKIKLLEKEKVEIANGKINLRKFGYFF